MTPQVGQRFGPYEILGTLGGGAMGMVFRAWDRRLQREVALKVLQENYQMPGMRERFLLEARAASALNHPNICTIFDMGDQDGDPYLVMELLEGETLKEKIQQGAVPVEEIVAYTMEIADALAAAHAKGIVHRDIKPANIFLVDKPTGRSQAKVLDFGLAKIGLTAGGGKSPRMVDLTQAGATVGTLAYMSPEQARGVALDERSDLFSLGVVMYEMATRQVPFQGATSALVFVQLLGNAPESPHYWNEAIPKDLDKIILRLLEKEARNRFQSAVDLHKALEKLTVAKAGGWLKKAAAVPLVRAEDPVARQKRVVPKPVSGQFEAKGAKASDPSTPAAPEESADNMLIRPFRGDATMERLARMEEELSGNPAPPAEAEPQDFIETIPPKTLSKSFKKLAPADADSTMLHNVAASSNANQQENLSDTLAQDEAEESDGSMPKRGSSAYDIYRASVIEMERRSFWTRSKLIVLAVVLICAVGTFALLRNVRLTPGLLGPNDALLLTMIQNKTLDKTLDGTVMAALEIDLKQSSYLKIRGAENFAAGLRQVEAEGERGTSPVAARRVAQAVGAKAYLYGEIRQSGDAFTISVDVLNAASNDKLITMVETAPSRDQLPAAIDRLASAVRSNMGESSRDISRTSVALTHEGSTSLDALHAYALGEAAMQQGKTFDAIFFYQQAIANDPKFVEAQLRLSWLYTAQKAEVAAAETAAQAFAASADSSPRLKLMAEFANELSAQGNYGRAAEIAHQLVTQYPRDLEALTDLARAERLQAHPAEALQAAQQAYSVDARSAEAYAEAERDMIALNHFDGALETEALAQRLGAPSGGVTIAAAYLDGRADVVVQQAELLNTADAKTQSTYGQRGDYALALDNGGHLAAAALQWRSAATSLRAVPALESTRSHVLAEAALDRALAGNCSLALPFAGEALAQAAGPEARFDAGMADALCGQVAQAQKVIDGLQQSYPKNTAVVGYYLPNLHAALALEAKDAEASLSALAGPNQYDLLSLTPYLRGQAHIAAGSAAAAVVDLQITLDHRGYAFLSGSNVYPMAQLSLAHAYAAMGDKTNSAAAQQRFQTLWKQADVPPSLK
jgi:eukaryotic-like serine/threonine-protein kinase